MKNMEQKAATSGPKPRVSNLPTQIIIRKFLGEKPAPQKYAMLSSSLFLLHILEALYISLVKLLNKPYVISTKATQSIIQHGYMIFTNKPLTGQNQFSSTAQGIGILATVIFYNVICIYALLQIARKYKQLQLFDVICKHPIIAYSVGSLFSGFLIPAIDIADKALKDFKHQKSTFSAKKDLVQTGLMLGIPSSILTTASYLAITGLIKIIERAKNDPKFAKQASMIVGTTLLAISCTIIVAGVAVKVYKNHKAAEKVKSPIQVNRR